MSVGQGNIGFTSPPIAGNPGGFTIPLMAQNSTYPASVTRFFGNLPINNQAAAALVTFTIEKNCIITACVIQVSSFAVAGTAEPWPMFVNVNGVDTLVDTVAIVGPVRRWVNIGLNIPITAGDAVVIKSVQPAFVAAPTSNVTSGYIICENA